MNVEAIQELGKFASNEDIADRLNETALRYADANLSKEDPLSIHPEASEDLFWLMQLRDFFRKL